MDDEKIATLHLRIKESILGEFNARSIDKFATQPSDMHRLIIQAFIDDRLTIHPNETQLNLFDLIKDRE